MKRLPGRCFTVSYGGSVCYVIAFLFIIAFLLEEPYAEIKDMEDRIHVRPSVCTYGHYCVSAQHTEHINCVYLAYLEQRMRRVEGVVVCQKSHKNGLYVGPHFVNRVRMLVLDVRRWCWM